MRGKTPMDWPGRRGGRNCYRSRILARWRVQPNALQYSVLIARWRYSLQHSSMMTIMTIMTFNREGAGMGAQNWTVAEAKAKFSEIIDRAMSEGPQTITRKGRTAAIVVGAEEWQRKTMRAGNLAEFFAGSPLRGSNLRVRRPKARPRKIRL